MIRALRPPKGPNLMAFNHGPGVEVLCRFNGRERSTKETNMTESDPKESAPQIPSPEKSVRFLIGSRSLSRAIGRSSMAGRMPATVHMKLLGGS